MIDTCTLLGRLPTPDEHRRLAEAAGWATALDEEAISASLEGSLAGVAALDGSRVAGRGRMVGDGASRA